MTMMVHFLGGLNVCLHVLIIIFKIENRLRVYEASRV